MENLTVTKDRKVTFRMPHLRRGFPQIIEGDFIALQWTLIELAPVIAIVAWAKKDEWGFRVKRRRKGVRWEGEVAVCCMPGKLIMDQLPDDLVRLSGDGDLNH